MEYLWMADRRVDARSESVLVDHDNVFGWPCIGYHESALQESEQRFRRIVDTVPGYVCTLSAAGEVELVNRQVLEYFGKTPEELKNWATSDAVHPEDLPRVIDAWRHSVETGQPFVLELRQRRADGVYRWFQSRAFPARDTEGRITGW
jgi:PAS domain S-box-containing protein